MAALVRPPRMPRNKFLLAHHNAESAAPAIPEAPTNDFPVRVREQKKWKLATERQPLDQGFRQAGPAHAFLDGNDVVGHAPEFYGLVLEVRYREGGARITVARLADRARIQKIAPR